MEGWRVIWEKMMKYSGAVMLYIYYACEFIENPWRKVLEQNKFRQENGNTEQQICEQN